MINVKIGLMLIASSASFLAPIAIQAEIYPQYVEIVKQSATCQCATATSDNLNADEAFLLNDDKIGDKAIAKFGCDCAAHRRTVFSEMRSTAQMSIKQIN